MAQKCRSRGWCFTINNYTDDDILEILYMHDNAVYTVFGFEVGEKGTPHIQGYTYFKNPIRFSTIKGLLTRANLREARGSADKNYDYCTKDNDFYEFGDRPEQGHRSDFDDLKEDIFTEKLSIREIAMKHTNTYMRYSGAVEKLTNMRATISDKCTVYHAKYDNYLAVCDHIFGTDVFEVRDDLKELYYYDNQECVIFMSGMNVNLLTLLLRNRPIRIGNGYMAKELLPPVVVFFDRYWKRENNTYGYLVNDLPKEIPGTEVSGVILGPDTSEEIFENSILSENFSDDDFEWD